MRAEAAGDPGPWRQQAVLGRGHCDADALRDVVRDYAFETPVDPDAVLVSDETGFLKQGKASCGAARKYTGSAEKFPMPDRGCSQPLSHATAMPSSTGRGQYDGVIHLSGDPICRDHALATALP
jgi:hypothetical protein